MARGQLRQKKGKRGKAPPEDKRNRKLKPIGKPVDLIKRVQLGLSETQYEIMQEMMTHTNSTFEQYLRDAVIGRIGADIDGTYIVGDRRREVAFKKLGEQR